jgi:leucyl aminopeptidase
LVVDIVAKAGGQIVEVENPESNKTGIEAETPGDEARFRPDISEGKIFGRRCPPAVFGSNLSRFLAFNHISEAWVKPDGLELGEAVLGSMLAQYKFAKYKQSKSEGEPTIHYVADSQENHAKLHAIADAVFFARDLGNEPAGSLPPSQFVESVKKRLVGLPVEIEALDERQLQDRGFGGIVAVGKGSHNPPRLLTLRYSGNGQKPLCVVGKGVVFDSGGINLKHGNIEMVYADKCGAADAVSVVLGAALLKLPADLMAVTPLVENMPSGTALKTGDVIRSYSGKTIEVLNTDAEGRLILADALSYSAKEFNPSAIVDIATLTSAEIAALGSRMAAVMGNDRDLVDRIIRSGNAVSEPFWELPLFRLYRKQLDSEKADIRNVVAGGFGEAGCIMAGLFLKEFVGQVPWAHLDVAGAAYSDADYDWITKGATGFSVRTILRLIEER